MSAPATPITGADLVVACVVLGAFCLVLVALVDYRRFRAEAVERSARRAADKILEGRILFLEERLPFEARQTIQALPPAGCREELEEAGGGRDSDGATRVWKPKVARRVGA